MAEQEKQRDPAKRVAKSNAERKKRSLRTVGMLLFVMVWVGGLGTWMAFGNSASWRKMLPKFNFSGTGMAGMRDGLGQRTDGASELSYLGDGKAQLGSFSIKVFDPITKKTMRTDFQLEGKTQFDEEDGFKDFMRDNNRRFREQVMVTLRNIRVDDLEDTELRLLEKKLVSRVNRNLGGRFLTSVDIKRFSLYESIDNSAFIETDASHAAAP